jgi:hypothetical protein
MNVDSVMKVSIKSNRLNIVIVLHLLIDRVWNNGYLHILCCLSSISIQTKLIFQFNVHSVISLFIIAWAPSQGCSHGHRYVAIWVVCMCWYGFIVFFLWAYF